MFLWKLENSYWWILKYLNCLSQHLRSTHKTTIPHLQLKLKMLWQQTCVCLLFSIFLGNHDSETVTTFVFSHDVWTLHWVCSLVVCQSLARPLFCPRCNPNLTEGIFKVMMTVMFSAHTVPSCPLCR
uniref:Uncharacterized protein n=1 Tax=Bubo bubo TaxID=30461 RepID=A0A8C0FSS2_BUBBB